jgi:hypothetical protein
MEARMRRPTKLAAVGWLTLAVTISVPAGWAASDQVVVDFENLATGAAPNDFTTGLTGEGKPVRWIVVEDDSAPSGTRALAESSGDATSYRFPLAIYDGLVAKDIDVSVRFKPISGEVDQAVGLIVRVLDTGNYYVARANALEDNVRLYKVVDGDREQFAGVDTVVKQGQWQTLGLRAEGDRFEISLNGDVLFSATDDTFSQEGRVGLWTKADSLTHFDDLAIRRLQ